MDKGFDDLKKAIDKGDTGEMNRAMERLTQAPDASPASLREMLGIADGATVPSVSVVVGSRRVEPELLHRMFFSSYGAVVH